MVYYKLIKIIINCLNFVKVIINIIIRDFNFSDLIIIDKSLFFTLKFWLSLYYFNDIKQKFSNTFYL